MIRGHMVHYCDIATLCMAPVISYIHLYNIARHTAVPEWMPEADILS